MANGWPWFRMFSDARTDKKLAVLTDAQHRVWFQLMCFAGEQPRRGEIRNVEAYELAIECASGDESLLTETIALLARLGIVRVTSRDRRDIGVTERDVHETGVTEREFSSVSFLHWDERQYDKPSDRPEETAERKRRQRENVRSDAASPTHLPSNKEVSRDVTPMSRDVTRSHDPDTDTDTELDTDTERERENTHVAPAARVRGYPPDFEAWWKRYPSGHGNKKASASRWASMSREDRRAAEDGLEKWLRCGRWKRGMVKAAEIWLRDQWWADAPPDDAARASPTRNGRATAQDFIDLMDKAPMHHQDTLKLLSTLRIRYPTAKLWEQDASATGRAWAVTLSDVDYDAAGCVLMDWCKREVWPPDPAEIRQRVRTRERDERTARESAELIEGYRHPALGEGWMQRAGSPHAATRKRRRT
jgi:hypothetical protein